MRVLVLALAILLLPLRGWLGDGMNTAMAIEAAQPAAAVHAMSADAHAMHGMQDTASSTSSASTPHDAQQHASHDCQSTCSDCQLCHSVAMAVWPEPTASIDVPRTAPAFAPAAFASAEPAQSFKPPIS
ncbi:MAG: hypothetical protein EOP77_00025 [Variovorax sp.]|nr:MAG: hypothetical protein EOP77_00025 [Variovorax sp.]